MRPSTPEVCVPARDPSVDQQRFVELCTAHHGRITAYAERRTADPQDAADVVSEVFLVVWRRIGEVPTGGRALPWLYGVARKVLANHHRTGRVGGSWRPWRNAASTRASGSRAGASRAMA